MIGSLAAKPSSLIPLSVLLAYERSAAVALQDRCLYKILI